MMLHFQKDEEIHFNFKVKGALDKYNIIPQLFPKNSWDFYTIRSIDCMLSLTF